MPLTCFSTCSASTRPLRVRSGRSIWVTSPVMTTLEPKPMRVRNIFIWFAALVIGRGLILGDIIALGLVALQKYTKFVSLDASVYYVDYVPVEINAPLILLINAATLAICLLVFIGPSYIVSHINPVKTIKYE